MTIGLRANCRPCVSLDRKPTLRSFVLLAFCSACTGFVQYHSLRKNTTHTHTFLKFWIIKLAQQPPMYTAALAKMFVGVLPIALLVHMSTACYMLGNVDILKIGFVRQVFVLVRVA